MVAVDEYQQVQPRVLRELVRVLDLQPENIGHARYAVRRVDGENDLLSLDNPVARADVLPQHDVGFLRCVGIIHQRKGDPQLTQLLRRRLGVGARHIGHLDTRLAHADRRLNDAAALDLRVLRRVVRGHQSLCDSLAVVAFKLGNQSVLNEDVFHDVPVHQRQVGQNHRATLSGHDQLDRLVRLAFLTCRGRLLEHRTLGQRIVNDAVGDLDGRMLLRRLLYHVVIRLLAVVADSGFAVAA